MSELTHMACPRTQSVFRPVVVRALCAVENSEPSKHICVSAQVSARLFFPGVVIPFNEEGYFAASSYELAERAYDAALRDLSEMA